MIAPNVASVIAPSAPARSGAPARPQTGGFAQELSAQLAAKAVGANRSGGHKTDAPVVGLGQMGVFPILPPQGMGAGAAAMDGLVPQGLAAAAARGAEVHGSRALEVPTQAAGGARDQASAQAIGHAPKDQPSAQAMGQAPKAQAAAGAKAQASPPAAGAQPAAASRTVPAAAPAQVRPAAVATPHASTVRAAAASPQGKAAPARAAAQASASPPNAATARVAAAQAAAPFKSVQGSPRNTATVLRRPSPAHAPSQRPKAAAVAAPRIAASSLAQGAPVKGAGTTAVQSAGMTGSRGEFHRIVADKQPSTAAAASAQPETLLGTNASVGLSHEVSVQIAQAARTEAPHLQSGGASMVRIALTPPQLGHVNVTLRAGAAGVTATLTAENPAAAAALQMGQGELRQRLESLGLGPVSVKVTAEARAGVPASRRSNAGGRR